MLVGCGRAARGLSSSTRSSSMASMSRRTLSSSSSSSSCAVDANAAAAADASAADAAPPLRRRVCLTYDYVDDMIRRREPVRAAHLAYAAAHKRADASPRLLAGGAFDNATGALLVFDGDDVDVVRAFVDADPYRKAGLIDGFETRVWNVVVLPDTDGTL